MGLLEVKKLAASLGGLIHGHDFQEASGTVLADFSASALDSTLATRGALGAAALLPGSARALASNGAAGSGSAATRAATGTALQTMTEFTIVELVSQSAWAASRGIIERSGVWGIRTVSNGQLLGTLTLGGVAQASIQTIAKTPVGVPTMVAYRFKEPFCEFWINGAPDIKSNPMTGSLSVVSTSVVTFGIQSGSTFQGSNQLHLIFNRALSGGELRELAATADITVDREGGVFFDFPQDAEPAVAATSMVGYEDVTGGKMREGESHRRTPNTALKYVPPGFPRYTGYTTVHVGGAVTWPTTSMDPNTDYLVIEDSPMTVPLQLIGGRNVVRIGGESAIPRNEPTGTLSAGIAAAADSTVTTAVTLTGPGIADVAVGQPYVIDPRNATLSETVTVTAVTSPTSFTVRRNYNANGLQGDNGGGPGGPAHSSGATIQRAKITGDGYGIFAKDWTGTLHIEGIEFTGAGVEQCIVIHNENVGAVAQVQNCLGSAHNLDWRNFHDAHPDGWQLSLGPATLLVDKVTLTTESNGLQWQPYNDAYSGTPWTGPPTWRLSRVNIKGTATARHLFFSQMWSARTGSPLLEPTPDHKFEQVYLQPPAARAGNTIYWDTAEGFMVGVPAMVENEPPGGDFVLTRSGGAYTSPGYARSRRRTSTMRAIELLGRPVIDASASPEDYADRSLAFGLETIMQVASRANSTKPAYHNGSKWVTSVDAPGNMAGLGAAAAVMARYLAGGPRGARGVAALDPLILVARKDLAYLQTISDLPTGGGINNTEFAVVPYGTITLALEGLVPRAEWEQYRDNYLTLAEHFHSGGFSPGGYSAGAEFGYYVNGNREYAEYGVYTLAAKFDPATWNSRVDAQWDYMHNPPLGTGGSPGGPVPFGWVETTVPTLPDGRDGAGYLRESHGAVILGNPPERAFWNIGSTVEKDATRETVNVGGLSKEYVGLSLNASTRSLLIAMGTGMSSTWIDRLIRSTNMMLNKLMEFTNTTSWVVDATYGSRHTANFTLTVGYHEILAFLGVRDGSDQATWSTRWAAYEAAKRGSQFRTPDGSSLYRDANYEIGSLLMSMPDYPWS